MERPEQEFIDAAHAARERVLATNISLVAVRETPFHANQRVQGLNTNLTVALASPEADDLRPEAKARLVAQQADLQHLVVVFYGADVLLSRSLGPVKDAERKRLTAANRANDKKYFPWAQICFGDHPTYGPVVRDIKRHSGHEDDARDVTRELDLLTSVPLPPGIVLPFTTEEMKRDAADAAAYLLLVDNEPPPVHEAALFRQKVYALIVALYDELRSFGLMLARKDPERASLFPTFLGG